MRYALHLTVILIAFGFMTGCNSSVDQNNKDELRTMSEAMAAGDRSLEGPLDLSRPAVIQLFRRTPHNSLRAICNGYCLRLLYSGEAKTVISGYLADPWLLAIKNPPAYSDWPGSTDSPSRLKVVVKAFHLEKRNHCPDAPNEESWDFLPKQAGSRPVSPSMAEQAELFMASGNCLIAEPVALGEASSVVTITHDDFNDYKRRMALKTTKLTVYSVENNTLIMRYRKTITQSSYVPQILPKGLDRAQFGVGTLSEPRGLVEISQKELGLKLIDPARPVIALREAVNNSLSNPELDAESSRWIIIDSYLRELSETRTLKPADLTTLAGIIGDPRLSYHLGLLAHALKPNAEKTRALAEPLLDAMLSIPLRTNVNGRVSKSWGIGRGALSNLAEAFALLPSEGVKDYEELLLRLIADSERMELAQLVIVQLSAVTPQRAIPVLRRIIDDNRDVAAIRLAMQAVCEMGPEAAPLKTTASDWLAGHPVVKGDNHYALSVTAQNAKAFLANLKAPGSQPCEHLNVSF